MISQKSQLTCVKVLYIDVTPTAWQKLDYEVPVWKDNIHIFLPNIANKIITQGTATKWVQSKNERKWGVVFPYREPSLDQHTMSW